MSKRLISVFLALVMAVSSAGMCEFTVSAEEAIEKVTDVNSGSAVVNQSVLNSELTETLTDIPDVVTATNNSYNASKALAYAKKNWNVSAYSILCAEFVSNCLKEGGAPSTVWSTRATVLRSQLKQSGMGKEYTCSLNKDGYLYQKDCPSEMAPGDVVFYYCPSCDDGKPYSIHVVLFNGFDANGRMKAYSHNGPSDGASAYKYSTKNGAAKCYDCAGQLSTVHIYHFNGNTNTSQSTVNKLPQGCLDYVLGGNGTITIYGWAFDANNYSDKVQVHVYVGGPAGVGTGYNVGVTNKSRPDVVKAYPQAQEYCGFNETIKVGKTGKQSVYVYAIDAQDSSKHTLLGSATVEIKKGFSMEFGKTSLNLKPNEQTSFSCKFSGDGIYTLGYTLGDSCIANLVGLSNMNWTTGTCNLYVEGLKGGKTDLTIYLLDSNMNTLYNKSIPITVTQSVTGMALNKTSTSLEVGSSEKLVATVAPSNATNKQVKWSSSNTSIATVDSNGTITAKAEGKVTITATAADGSGKKASCTVTVTKPFTPLSITFDKASVELYEGDTQTVNIGFVGEGIYCLQYAFSKAGVATATWNSCNYQTGKTSITLRGADAGSTTLTIRLLNSSNRVLHSKSLTVKVNAAVVSQGFALNDEPLLGIDANEMIGAQEQQIRSFVQRMYTVALGRTAEAEGVDYWTDLLHSGKTDGEDVAHGFFHGNEFRNKRLTNAEYVDILYGTFFNRKPAASETSYYATLLAQGVSRDKVLDNFIASNEFVSLCEKYGIEAQFSEDNSVRGFVERMYTVALGRSADAEGVTYHVSRLQNRQNDGEDVAKGFFGSAEFKNRNLNDRAYVQTLYKTFFDRESGESEISYYENILKTNTREDVLNNFIHSAEFARLCDNYGITAVD